MSRRKPWSHFPDRIYDDERYLSLDDTAALGFHRMHIKCDRHGRGIAGDHALAGAVRTSPDKARHIRTCLDAAGLVRLFTSAEGLLCYEIADYDRDAPAGTLKNRKASDHERPAVSGPVETNPDRAPEEIEIEIETEIETTPSACETRAPTREAPTHTDGPDTKQDPAQLSPAARSWLEHRVEVTRRNGHAMATMGEAEDLLGFPLRALQRKPGFAESVAKMLALPDSKWGRSLRAGFAYLERMVADYIPEQAAVTNEHQSHMGGLAPSCEEYYQKTGFDPREAETYDPLEDLLQPGVGEGAGA